MSLFGRRLKVGGSLGICKSGLFQVVRDVLFGSWEDTHGKLMGWAVGGSCVVLVSGLAGSMCLLGDTAAVAPTPVHTSIVTQQYGEHRAFMLSRLTKGQWCCVPPKNSTVTWNVVLASLLLRHRDTLLHTFSGGRYTGNGCLARLGHVEGCCCSFV